jgi:hypothetical protein
MDGLPKQLTITNKLITQVYRRRRYKSRGKEVDETAARQVFDAPIPEYEKVLDDLNSPIASVKRKVTPVSTDSLRRSERKSAVHKGFKPSPSTSKVKGCKKNTASIKKSKSFFTTSYFHDLVAIDALFATSDKYPEIYVQQLQKVVVESYGIPPVEATVGLLLATDAGEN